MSPYSRGPMYVPRKVRKHVRETGEATRPLLTDEKRVRAALYSTNRLRLIKRASDAHTPSPLTHRRHVP